MYFNHSVSDLVARVKNGYLASKDFITSPTSRMRVEILDILKNEGYILGYTKFNNDNQIEQLSINLKYHSGQPVVSEIFVVSKPGRRVYSSADKIPVIKNGLGTLLLSTSKGILSDSDARKDNIGGELLLKIF